jgi:hypothetical protein
MSDKFDMKLVIDAVTTPLLHARLSQTSSFRDRAALLRSLAEAALRGDAGTFNRVEESSPLHVEPVDRAALPGRRPRQLLEPLAPPPTSRGEIVDSTSTRLIVDDPSGAGHDAEQLANEFQAFF